MFRFTIRDVLWLTALVGPGVGWWLDCGEVEASRATIRDHAIADEIVDWFIVR